MLWISLWQMTVRCRSALFTNKREPLELFDTRHNTSFALADTSDAGNGRRKIYSRYDHQLRQTVCSTFLSVFHIEGRWRAIESLSIRELGQMQGGIISQRALVGTFRIFLTQSIKSNFQS